MFEEMDFTIDMDTKELRDKIRERKNQILALIGTLSPTMKEHTTEMIELSINFLRYDYDLNISQELYLSMLKEVLSTIKEER